MRCFDGGDEANLADAKESVEPLTAIEQSEQPTQILPTVEVAEQREGAHPEQEEPSSKSSADAHEALEHEDEGAIGGFDSLEERPEENLAIEVPEGIEDADNLLDALSPEELDAFDEMEIGLAAGPEESSVVDLYGGEEDALLGELSDDESNASLERQDGPRDEDSNLQSGIDSDGGSGFVQDTDALSEPPIPDDDVRLQDNGVDKMDVPSVPPMTLI